MTAFQTLLVVIAISVVTAVVLTIIGWALDRKQQNKKDEYKSHFYGL